VQVRELLPPARATFAVRAFIQGGDELAPDAVDDRTLAEAIGASLRGHDLAVRVHARRLHFRVRDQLRLFAETSWPALVAGLSAAERRARAARARGASFAVVHLLWARALVSLLVDAAHQLDAHAAARLAPPLARLALDPGAAHAKPRPTAAHLRWAPALLPWRAGLAALIARRVSRLVDAYLATRASLPPPEQAAAALPDAIAVDERDAIVPLPSAGATAAVVPIQPGAATGPLRRVESPADLVRVAAGDVVWSPGMHAWLTHALPCAAAVLAGHGGGLTHLALNCRARGVPCASGVSVAAWADGTRVAVEIDETNCAIAAAPDA
jgi:hypothetical protein